MICPICNKKGLKESDTKCPQCDSDFSHLTLLNNLKFNNKGKSLSKSILIIAIAIFVASIAIDVRTLYFETSNNVNNDKKETNNSDNKNSSQFSADQNNKKPTEVDSLELYFDYLVMPGDNLKSISSRLKMSKTQLERAIVVNAIKNRNFIQAGRTLTIPFNNVRTERK